MKPKMKIFRSLASMLVLMAIIGLMGAAGVAADKVVKIGITQIVEHPSLDASRQGFIDALAELGYVEGKNVVYDFQNAQGDMPTAQTIANKFVSDKVDLILAIATPTAQAAANATDKIPILITAVTDPKVAGLVKDYDKPGTNVTGTSDLNPVDKQLALVKDFRPNAKRVGILYNAGEPNSLVQVEMARSAAEGLGLKLVEVTVSTSSGVYQAAQSLIGRVDAIYVPTDNTVVSALESVIKVAEDADLPLIVGEGDSVVRGGLASVGIDYYKLGYQTGKMAYEVLNGKNPAEMAIQYQEDLELIINKTAAKNMGIELTAQMLAKADKLVE